MGNVGHLFLGTGKVFFWGVPAFIRGRKGKKRGRFGFFLFFFKWKMFVGCIVVHNGSGCRFSVTTSPNLVAYSLKTGKVSNYNTEKINNYNK